MCDQENRKTTCVSGAPKRNEIVIQLGYGTINVQDLINHWEELKKVHEVLEKETQSLANELKTVYANKDALERELHNVRVSMGKRVDDLLTELKITGETADTRKIKLEKAEAEVERLVRLIQFNESMGNELKPLPTCQSSEQVREEVLSKLRLDLDMVKKRIAAIEGKSRGRKK